MDDDTRERLAEELRSIASLLQRQIEQRPGAAVVRDRAWRDLVESHHRLLSVAFELDPRDERQRAGVR